MILLLKLVDNKIIVKKESFSKVNKASNVF